jgi:hypothetical protein
MQTDTPQPHEESIMATTTFSGPVVSNNGFSGNLTGSAQLPTYTVASAPAATDLTGTIIYVSNGLAGAPCVAVSDGTNWISPAGTTIAAA